MSSAEPGKRGGEPADRRPVKGTRLVTSGGADDRERSRVVRPVLLVVYRAEADVGRLEQFHARRADVQATGSLRPAEPLLAGKGVEVDAERAEVDLGRAHRLGAVHEDQGTAVMRERGDLA